MHAYGAELAIEHDANVPVCQTLRASLMPTLTTVTTFNRKAVALTVLA